jgi:TRAP transporter TAXI family solute receptor
VLSLASAAFAAGKDSVTLGSTNSTSSHYVVSVAMGKAIQAGMKIPNVSVLETGASVDNIRRLSRNEIDAGLVAIDAGIQAVDGTGSFAGKPVADLAALYAYDVSVLNIAVRADAGVATLKDLSGKKFNAGIRGSGAEMLTREAFAMLGIEPSWSPGTVKDAVEGIQNRQVVGYSKYGTGTGIDATLRELMTSTDMRLVGFSPDDRKKVQEKVKGVDFVTLPENLIPNQPSIVTPSVPITYSARTGTMDDDTAYAITKAIYENRAMLIEAWPHLAKFDFKQQALNLEKIGFKLHPGAKRFWESVK